ncbi:MAG: hypothetical protein OXT03_06385 [Alphaproteobacteria bacterium]|nr:hypothetical protein [Alphaproteobacteria bacterium]
MIEILTNNILWGLIAGGSSLVLALFMYPLAHKYGFTDKPGGHKYHDGEIPFIGGVCIYFTIAVTVFVTETVEAELKWLIGTAGLLVLIGMIDDLFDMKPIYKLFAQILITSIMCFGSAVHIQTLGILPSGFVLDIGIFGYIITIIAVVGIVNAFNIIDGMDGLAGLLAIFAVAGIAFVLTFLNRTIIHGTELVVFCSAIGGYLLINMAIVSRRKIFLGDSGSMLIGFVVAWVMIYYSQLPNDRAIPASMTLWLMALPVINTLAIIFYRSLKRRSPLKADRKSLYHICLRLGMSPNQTLAVMCLFSIALTIFGFIVYLLAGDLGAFIALIVITWIYYQLIKYSWRISVYIRKQNWRWK